MKTLGHIAGAGIYFAVLVLAAITFVDQVVIWDGWGWGWVPLIVFAILFRGLINPVVIGWRRGMRIRSLAKQIREREEGGNEDPPDK